MFDYINEYCVQERRIKGATILQYNRDCKSYIQKYSISRQQLQNLSKDVFNDYYAKLAEKYAEKSIHGAVMLCGSTCEWLVERSLLEENFAKQAKVKIKTRSTRFLLHKG